MAQGHGHEHGDPEHGHPAGAHSHGHTHGVVDPSIASNDRGLWALKWSFVGLMATALIQVGVVAVSGSVGLLADTIHNFADAATAIPLGVAFLLAKRRATRRFTYGLGRVEDLAGLAIIVTITASAVFASYEAIHRLLHPQPVEMLWAVIGASVIGFVATRPSVPGAPIAVNARVMPRRPRKQRGVGAGAPDAGGGGQANGGGLPARPARRPRCGADPHRLPARPARRGTGRPALGPSRPPRRPAVRVPAQGRRAVRAPSPRPELRALRRLRRGFLHSAAYVFTTERGRSLTDSGVRKIVARAGPAAALPFPVHPHMLRHATGYKLANDGQDTRAIQHYLGHKNIVHTTRYTNLAPDRFKTFWRD